MNASRAGPRSFSLYLRIGAGVWHKTEVRGEVVGSKSQYDTVFASGVDA